MPAVKIKFVVSFTSQDENFKAANLLSTESFKKWLSSPKEKPVETSVTLQLENECIISYIDIGTHWCANIEIQVGRSDWPEGREYETLAPTCIMMKPVDCNLSRNITCTRMFSSKDFNSEISLRSWDRIRIICRQPLRKDVQFGLLFLRIKTADTGTSSAATSEQKSVKSIQKHFFGKTKTSNTSDNMMKTKLLRMVGSAENGTDHEDAMSRTAKLVLAASAGNKQRETTVKSPFYSDTLDQKQRPEFKEEVESFLDKLEINEDELDKVTIADLRHKLERKKKRKLNKEERKLFAELARSYICKLFGESEDEMTDTKTKRNEICKEKQTTRIKERVTPLDSVANSSDPQIKERVTSLDSSMKKCDPQIKEGVTSLDSAKNNSAVYSNLKTNQLVYGNFHMKNEILSPEAKQTMKNKPMKEKNTNMPSKSTLDKDDVNNQLKQIREKAHQIYKSNLDKNQQSENCGSKLTGINDKNKEDDIYKSMSYLERKAFALTNPYKVSRYGNSLSFGPKQVNEEDTNNQWLSTLTPPGKRKRGSSPGSTGKRKRGSESVGKSSKLSKKGDVSKQEVRPTSFERCHICKETFPPSQISNHLSSCKKVGATQISDSDTSPECVACPIDTTPEYIECPICSQFYTADVIQFHASVCCDS